MTAKAATLREQLAAAEREVRFHKGKIRAHREAAATAAARRNALRAVLYAAGNP